MAVKDVVQQAKNSRLGKVIRNLSSNFSNWQANNRASVSPGGNLDTRFRNSSTAQTVADSTQGFFAGNIRGQLGGTGAEKFLPKSYADVSAYRAQTPIGKFAEGAGTLSGYVMGVPGKIAGGASLLPKLGTMAKNAVIGGAFGAGSTAISDLLQGKRPTLDSSLEGARQGAGSSWIFPATNKFADLALGAGSKLIPQLANLTDDALKVSGNAMKQGSLSKILRQAPKQILKGSLREASETPLETAFFATKDTADKGGTYAENYKNRFVGDLLSNAAIGGVRQGVGLTPAAVKAGKGEFDAMAEKNAAQMGLTKEQYLQRGAIGEKAKDPLTAEAQKYGSAEEFINKANTINPSEQGIFQDYTPELRNKIPLGDNMQTLDKSIGGKADDIVTIYRGTSGNKINAGDFITTNKQLASDYAGNGNVKELRVRKGDIIDVIDESGGEEYLYRPNADKEGRFTKSQLTDIYNQAKATPAPGMKEGTSSKSLQPEIAKSSRTKIATQETQNPKLQTFQGEPIEPTGVKILTKKAGKAQVVSDDSSKIIISRDKKYAFNINKQKLQLDEAQSKELDSVVEVMRPVLEKNKGKTLTKQEIINGGRKAQVLTDVVGRDEAKQFGESLQASRNLLRSEQAQVGITPKFLEQLEVVSSVAADAGRRLQAFNIGAEDITIKEMLLRDILKTGADVEGILKAGKEVDWNNAKEITDFYRKFKPATLADKLDEFRYTNMLSSPNTHINNAFSNFLQTAILAPVEKTVRGSVDFAQSKLTGKEQEYFARQGVDYARGYWKALPDAFGNFKKTLAGVEGLTKPDVEFIPTSTSKLRQIYTFPLQALEASDQFFRTLVKGGEMESLKTEGITGAKASKIAEQQANYRTFRQAFDPDGKLGQNGVLKVWDKWNVAINNLRSVPGGKWLVPFLQTPTNILKQGFEYSPLGFTTVRGSGEPATQMAKAIIGSTVFTGAYAMASSGLTTWDTPTNATEKAEFYAAGLQPYSMKIGGKWVSYSKLGPLAYPIAMASALKWAQDNGGDNDALTTMGMAFSGTLGFFADQSYVKGIGDIIDALRGDEYKQARGFSNIPAQMIPYRSFMGWVARQVDPVRRKTSGGSPPEQIGKSIVSQIPFASQSLEAHQTPFGEESLRQFPTINAFSPFSISQEKPKEKEYYDARQKLRNQNREVKKVLDKIEAGKGVTLNTDNLLTKQVVSLTKKKVEAGIDVTQQELETAYLSQPLAMPKTNRYEKSQRDSGLYASLSTIEGNEYLTDQQKTDLKGKVASELGKTPRDLQIYSVAKEDNDSKTLYAYDQIDNSTSFDDTMRYLVNGRKPINGQMLVSDGVINNLVADGVIPYALGKDIKEIDLNEDGTRRGTIKSRMGGRGGGGSKKSHAARLQAFNDLGEDLKKIKIGTSKIRTTQSQRITTKGLTFSGA